MFHDNPKLLFLFLIIVGGLVALFSKMGWGTNHVLLAIAVAAGTIFAGKWLWKRVARLSPGRDKGTMLHFMLTGQTDPAQPGALVQYQPRYLQHYGYADTVQVTEEGGEGVETEGFDEEYDDEQETEGFDEEYDDEQETEGFDEEENVQQGFRDTGPNSMAEQTGIHSQRELRNAGQFMRLASDLTFHPDLLLSGRLSAFGLPNSGKSNLIGVVCEELGRLQVPFVLADTEDEYSQLVDRDRTWLPQGYTAGSPLAFPDGTQPPPHYIAVDQSGAYYLGRLVLDHGYQVILNLESYDTEEEAALVMCEVVRGMRDWEQEQPPNERVSCMFILEEASTWLPQNTRESRLTSQTLALLQSTMFNMVVRKGRKRGIGFMFACQRAAELDKRAMQSSWRFLLQQTERNDLDVYEEMCPQIDRERVQQFVPGEAVVMGPGVLQHTRIRKRNSPHGAHTPGLASVQRRYGNRTGQRLYTQDLTAHILARAAQGNDARMRQLAGGDRPSPPATSTHGSAQGESISAVHPSQLPQANSEQQLAWGCAVLHYLNALGEPWTPTAVRRPRRELKNMALALGVIKQDAEEIIGGGSRAERIKSEVDQLSAPRSALLLRLANQAQETYQPPVLAQQADTH